MSRIRIIPAISALVLTFAVLFGGFQVYRNYEQVRPLQSQLAHLPQVQNATVNMNGNSASVHIALKPIADLQDVYTQIQNDVVATLGTPVSISLQDRRDVTLEKAYESLQPILYTGIAQGNYTGMISALEKQCHSQHIASHITMNAQDIFVQLSKGHNYLYEIVPYQNKTAGGSGQ